MKTTFDIKLFALYLIIAFLNPFRLSAQDWKCPLTISGIAGEKTITQQRTFGGDSLASDFYDSGLDIIAPPAAFGFYTYFEIDVFPYSLDRDIKPFRAFQKDSVVWDLNILGFSESQLTLGQIEWNPDSLPPYGKFTIGGQDMRTTRQTIFSSDTVISIKYQPDPPEALFSATPVFGVDTLTVHFTDNSTGIITSWLWDFGDSDTSHVQNPVHEYTYADSFTVTLIVSGPVGSDTLSMPDYIIVQEQKPVAHFGLKQIIGLPPLTVEFTDSSTGVITSWLWDFGDGDTSHVQNPIHTYTIADTFTVTLTVSGPGGADTLCLNNLIIVLNPSAVQNESNIPTEFSLMPIYPNPFNPVANIRFTLPKQTNVEINIYNIYGNKVEQVSLGLKQPGIHLWEWDASRFSTGTYLVRIQAAEFHDVRKCVLMK